MYYLRNGINANLNIMKCKLTKWIAAFLLLSMVQGMKQTVKAEVDPNFYIYLCIGQSNMAGGDTRIGLQESDKVGVDTRFRNLQTCDGNGSYYKGQWRRAVPPLARANCSLSPADYFGRTMVKNLPDSIRVGVVLVAVEGCSIVLFDKAQYRSYYSSAADWMKNIIKTYNSYGNVYSTLTTYAKQAQQLGVIKGILLHQGETDAYSDTWLDNVNTVYKNILKDLSLNAADVPLIAGEVVDSEQGGQCASANNTINRLPKKIKTAHVVSSKGCTDCGDNLHFSPEGYRLLGQRYAEKALEILEEQRLTAISPVFTPTPASDIIYNLNGERLEAPQKGINIINGKKVLVK